MDSEQLTEQYIELTREIELEDLKEKEMQEEHNEEIVKKGKKFSFKAPQLTRKPSVYEDKSHVTIIRAAIILGFGMSSHCCNLVWILCNTYSKTEEPAKPENQLTVEGEVDPVPPDNHLSNPRYIMVINQNTTEETVQFTRNDFLDYSFVLPADATNISH